MSTILKFTYTHYSTILKTHGKLHGNYYHTPLLNATITLGFFLYDVEGVSIHKDYLNPSVNYASDYIIVYLKDGGSILLYRDGCYLSEKIGITCIQCGHSIPQELDDECEEEGEENEYCLRCYQQPYDEIVHYSHPCAEGVI